MANTIAYFFGVSMALSKDEQIRRMSIVSKVLKEAREVLTAQQGLTCFPVENYYNMIFHTEDSINKRIREVKRGVEV